jgi:hypothetical protein
MTPVDRARLEKCLAAAARIAAGAGLTLAEAARAVRPPWSASSASRPPPRRSYAWAEPKPEIEPVTVEELLRQKAQTEAWRKRTAATDARRRRRERAEQDAYAAEQRAKQAERDRDWARSRAGLAVGATDDV